jgi:predicted RND superfamily exporter protein
VTPNDASLHDPPVVADLKDFDPRAGGLLERLIFNHRPLIVLLALLATVLLGWQATKLTVNASFEKMLPVSHPYIRNFLDNAAGLRGLGNSVRIVVAVRDGQGTGQGDIFDPRYLSVLQKINDQVFLTPGVDRSWMKSLWAPVVRWSEVTEQGYEGGPVMPENYDGSANSIAQLKANAYRAGLVGDLVGTDLRSSTIFVPLLDRDVRTGQALDYGALSRTLDGIVAAHAQDVVDVHIVGFARLTGELIAGLGQVMLFFLLSIVIVGAVLYLHTRCVRSTFLVLGTSVAASVWLLGLIQLAGRSLDPYSVLVPFLIFSIGASHGTQKMNGVMHDVARGTHRYVAARYTFRRLFMAGLTAVLCNVVGFAVLLVIDIPAIREMALMTSAGVLILILVKLILLPVLLSYTGVSRSAAARRLVLSQREAERGGWQERLLLRFTERRWAVAALLGAAAVFIVSFAVSLNLKIGDLDPGAPELRADSRYNRDVAYVNAHYGLSPDQFAVIVKTPPGGCELYTTLVEMDRLGQTLRSVQGVQSVVSAADVIRTTTSAMYEGAPKWVTLSRNPDVIRGARNFMVSNQPHLGNDACSLAPVIAYLADHKAETLSRVVTAVEDFAKVHNTPELQFLPAAGTAGIEAVTNIVVEKANRTMLLYLYGAVTLLCFVAFRNWRAVLVAMVPLVIVSAICEALMVGLGIGIKVATLPVIALGVGVGVDYALYLLSVQLFEQRRGKTLREAYASALNLTGRVVLLVGLTMAAGVVTWAGSPIKFQADMGILLTFMFLWNMVGALVLIPALSHFLLPGPRRPAEAQTPMGQGAGPGVGADVRSWPDAPAEAHERQERFAGT